MRYRSVRVILAALPACLFLAAATCMESMAVGVAPHTFLYAVTQGRYDDKGAARGVLEEFGQDARMADWNEIKALYGHDMTAFLQSAGVQTDVDVWLTRGGEEYSGRRHYFLARISSPRVDFLLHDKIGDTAWLGSWYGIKMPVLVRLAGSGDGSGVNGTPGQGQATPAPADPAAIRLLFVGNWCDAGIGGMMYTNYVEFYADGTCAGYLAYPAAGFIDASSCQDMSLYTAIRKGTWQADAYDPALGLFRDNSVPFILTITGDDGAVDRFGVTVHDTEHMTFITSEGAGGYIRVGPRLEATPTPAGPDTAIRTQLAGCWCTSGIGGIIYADVIDLSADGACAGYAADPMETVIGLSNYRDLSLYDTVRRGIWDSGAYDPALGLFWDNGVPYILTIAGDDGTIEQFGVRLYGTDNMTLVTSEGAGGYVRAGRLPGV